MRTQWRVLLGAATAACVAVVLGWGQPWLTRSAHAYSWEEIGCGSADGGDEVWMASGWVVWWTAGAVAIGVLAGARVFGLSRGFAGDPRQVGEVAAYGGGYLALLVVAVAGAAAGVLSALGGLTALAGNPSCHGAAGYGGDVVTGAVLAAIAVALVAVLPENAFAVVAGWAWMWLLNGHTYVRYLLGDDGLQHVGDTEGTGDNGVFHALSTAELVTGIVVLVGYLGVLPGLVWWRAYRGIRRDGGRDAAVRALAGVFVVHLPVFVGLVTR